MTSLKSLDRLREIYFPEWWQSIYHPISDPRLRVHYHVVVHDDAEASTVLALSPEGIGLDVVVDSRVPRRSPSTGDRN